jgi:uncharacterized membrane protein
MAWGTGVVSFVSTSVGLGLAPKPLSGTSTPAEEPQLIVSRKVIRRVIVWKKNPKSETSVTYVYGSKPVGVSISSGGGASFSSGGGGGGSSSQKAGRTKGSHH